MLGTARLAGGLEIDGSLHASGARLDGPLELGAAEGKAQIRATDTPVRSGDACAPEGTLLISTPPGRPAQLWFCSGAHWQAVSVPRP